MKKQLKLWINFSNDAIDKRLSIIAEPETVEIIHAEHQKILKQQKMLIFEQTYILNENNRVFDAISLKCPWQDTNDKIIGIFSFPTLHGIALSLHQLSTLELFNINFYNTSLLPCNDEIYLSFREKECIFYLILSYTIKMISMRINLCPRIIEHYIENIKNKLKVYPTSELIEK